MKTERSRTDIYKILFHPRRVVGLKKKLNAKTGLPMRLAAKK